MKIQHQYTSRTKMILIFCIFLSIGLYLNRAYAHIYATLRQKHLSPPPMQQHILVTARPENTAVLNYVALGDSLTAGTGASSEAETYPYALAKLWSEKKQKTIRLTNVGMPGATSVDVLKNQVPLALAQHPDVVTLLIGINDMHNQVPLAQFKKNILGIVDALGSTTTIINVVTIPYLGKSTTFLPPYRYYFNRQTKKYNTALREALAEKQVHFIDLYSLMKDSGSTRDIDSGQTYYATDGFHPNSSGYAYWSQRLYEHLNF